MVADLNLGHGISGFLDGSSLTVANDLHEDLCTAYRPEVLSVSLYSEGRMGGYDVGWRLCRPYDLLYEYRTTLGFLSMVLIQEIFEYFCR